MITSEMGAPKQEQNVKNKKWIPLQNKTNPHPGTHIASEVQKLLLDRATY